MEPSRHPDELDRLIEGWDEQGYDLGRGIDAADAVRVAASAEHLVQAMAQRGLMHVRGLVAEAGKYIYDYQFQLLGSDPILAVNDLASPANLNFVYNPRDPRGARVGFGTTHPYADWDIDTRLVGADRGYWQQVQTLLRELDEFARQIETGMQRQIDGNAERYWEIVPGFAEALRHHFRSELAKAFPWLRKTNF